MIKIMLVLVLAAAGAFAFARSRAVSRRFAVAAGWRDVTGVVTASGVTRHEGLDSDGNVQTSFIPEVLTGMKRRGRRGPAPGYTSPMLRHSTAAQRRNARLPPIRLERL